MLTALLLSLSLAAPGVAPGDAIYVTEGPEVTLNAGQKTALSGLVSNSFAGIKPADLERLYCFASPEDSTLTQRKALVPAAIAASNKWSCVAEDNNPITSDADALDWEIDGVCKIVRKGSSDILRCENGEMDAAGKTIAGTLAQSVFGVGSLNLIWTMHFYRDADVLTTIKAKPYIVKIAPPAQWRSDRDAGLVVLTIGRVAL